MRLVEVYNARLTGRERRRAFIRDRGLLNVKRMQVGASPFCEFPLCRAVVQTPGGTNCDTNTCHTGSGRGRAVYSFSQEKAVRTRSCRSIVLAKRGQSGLGHISGWLISFDIKSIQLFCTACIFDFFVVFMWLLSAASSKQSNFPRYLVHVLLSRVTKDSVILRTRRLSRWRSDGARRTRGSSMPGCGRWRGISRSRSTRCL